MPYAHKICGVYRLTNRINGLSYIGQSVDIKTRWCQLKIAYKPALLICQVIAEIGWDKFDVEILVECKRSELDSNEEHFIRLHNTLYPHGYNQRHGGRRGKQLDLQKQRCSDKTKGKPKNWTEEGRKRVAVTQFKSTPEHSERVKQQWATRSHEAIEDISAKISHTIKRLHQEKPGVMRQKPFIPDGVVKQCTHCRCFRKLEDFFGKARHGSKRDTELKHCSRCRKR